MAEVIATNLGLQTEQVKAKKIWNEGESGIASGRVFPFRLRKVVLFFRFFFPRFYFISFFRSFSSICFV